MATDDLPEISPVVVDAIVDMLVADQGMLRPPEKAARLLAFIVELYKAHRPFPERAEVAEHIGASVSTIDAALSTRLNEGYIKLRVETPDGYVQRRNSVVRDRYYDPCPQLLDVVERAKRRC
jgi:hypothetical protein